MSTKDSLVDLTKELISYKTVTGDHKMMQKAFGYVQFYLKKDLYVETVEFGGYPSLIITNHKESGKSADLLMHGHMDVVPASDEDFIPHIEDDRIYGRGALDMKGGLAVLIELMKNHASSSKKLTLLISSDEETGGSNGTEKLIKELGYRGSFFITAEGEKQYVFKTEQKGVVMIRVTAQGKGDHSAYTWNGDNAILKLMDFYTKLKNNFPVHPKNKDHWYSTINLGKIAGGLAVNSIPESAEAEIDIRFCKPYYSTKDVLDVLDNAISDSPGISYEVKYMTDMMKTDLSNPLLSRLNALARTMLKIPHDLYFKNHGTNDARFASHVGIPAVAFGPIGDNYHASGEYVSIQSLLKYYDILSTFLSK